MSDAKLVLTLQVYEPVKLMSVLLTLRLPPRVTSTLLPEAGGPSLVLFRYQETVVPPAGPSPEQLRVREEPAGTMTGEGVMLTTLGLAEGKWTQ